VITGTAWNSSYNGGARIDAPAFDIDGNPASFSESERNVIIETWLRVAEDFAPFNVDVTTELTSEAQLTRSSSSDTVFGTRILISPISQYFGPYGGIAYVGVFDDVGDTYKPALVFPENLGNTAKNITEAASHECGHNLGLNHDGTAATGYYSGHGSGATGWAPLMGVGYYQNLSQWSRGEYLGANNAQNDLLVMTSYGLPVRPDDHGNAANSATALTGQASLFGEGVIETASDVDVFWFSVGASSAVTVNVNPATVGPNLDILAEIRDANGTLLGTSNPVDGLGAAFTGQLDAGTYFVHVGGTGMGDPLGTGYTDYGSLGQFVVTGSVGVANQAPVAIIQATPTSGTAPVAVAFNGAGSSDVDGSVVSYAWNFGDGTTGSGVSVSKTYSAAGTFTAVLTVVDNLGATGTASQVITVSAPSTQFIRVQSITLTKTIVRGKSVVKAAVKVTDLNGAVVSGVKVNGKFAGAVAGNASGTTDSAGTATLTSKSFTTSGVVTLNVTGLVKTGCTYSSANNLVTSASIQ
jgi:PKD repeat protein